MTRHLTIVLTLIVTGCGNSHTPFIDPDAQQYVDEFQNQYGVSVNVPVTFTDKFDSGPMIVGMCYTNGSVSLLRSYWDDADDTQRHLLVYHELGHCVLNRQHREDTFKVIGPYDPSKGLYNPVYFYPMSIMYPYTFDSGVYLEYKDMYDRELRQ